MTETSAAVRQWYRRPAEWQASRRRWPPKLAGLSLSRLLATSLCLLIVSVFFLVFPGVDTWVSALFVGEGGGFPIAHLRISADIRLISRIVTIAALAVSMGALLVHLFWRRPVIVLLTPSEALFLLLSYALVPGLVVNGILKEFWGRARPRALAEFHSGGESFTPAWVFADNCRSNCSFASGEASSAMAMVAIILILPLAWRPAARQFIIPAVIIMSVNRIAMGGHFLSDVVIAWCLTLMGIFWLRSVMLADVRAARLDDAVSGAGRRLLARLSASLSRLGQKNAQGKEREDAGKQPVDDTGDDGARLEPAGQAMRA
jgi:lipid A 4'-phosphatase